MNLAVAGDQRFNVKKSIAAKDKPLAGFPVAWPWPVLHDGGSAYPMRNGPIFSVSVEEA